MTENESRLRLPPVAAGSTQLRTYRTTRRDGQPTEIAAQMAGISLVEAKLIDADDAKYPPGPECYEPITPPPPVGHNSKELNRAEGNVAVDQFRHFIERIERLEEEKKGIADDIKDVYSEAKSQGYDGPAMRLMVRLRKMDKDKLQESQAIAQIYASALGLQFELAI